MNDIPKWAIKYIKSWKKRLFMHEWEIAVSLDDTPGGKETNWGFCGTIRGRKVGYITLHTSILDKDSDRKEWQHAIIHELLHCKFARLDDEADNKHGYKKEAEYLIDSLALVLWRERHL